MVAAMVDVEAEAGEGGVEKDRRNPSQKQLHSTAAPATPGATAFTSGQQLHSTAAPATAGATAFTSGQQLHSTAAPATAGATRLHFWPAAALYCCSRNCWRHQPQFWPAAALYCCSRNCCNCTLLLLPQLLAPPPSLLASSCTLLLVPQLLAPPPSLLASSCTLLLVPQLLAPPPSLLASSCTLLLLPQLLATPPSLLASSCTLLLLPQLLAPPPSLLASSCTLLLLPQLLAPPAFTSGQQLHSTAAPATAGATAFTSGQQLHSTAAPATAGATAFTSGQQLHSTAAPATAGATNFATGQRLPTPVAPQNDSLPYSGFASPSQQVFVQCDVDSESEEYGEGADEFDEIFNNVTAGTASPAVAASGSNAAASTHAGVARTSEGINNATVLAAGDVISRAEFEALSAQFRKVERENVALSNQVNYLRRLNQSVSARSGSTAGDETTPNEGASAGALAMDPEIVPQVYLSSRLAVGRAIANAYQNGGIMCGDSVAPEYESFAAQLADAMKKVPPHKGGLTEPCPHLTPSSLLPCSAALILSLTGTLS
ncbi:unnamed protein product [Closterium sp. NIES-64]|nr:unnamed protein product [Closterium sp. NIES-64]